MSGFSWGKNNDKEDNKESDRFTLDDLKLILTAYGKEALSVGGNLSGPPHDFTEGGPTVDISNKLIRHNLNCQYRVLQPNGMTRFILNNSPEVLKSVMYAFYPELSDQEIHQKLLTVIDKHIIAVRNTADTLQTLRDKLS